MAKTPSPTKKKPAAKKPAAKKRQPKVDAAINVLDVRVVWDMSGSMGRVHMATLEGMKQYVHDLQESERALVEEHGPGTYTRLSLTAFDTVYERWYVRTPILDIKLSDLDRYMPRGGTALYDAIAVTVTEADTEARGEKVLAVVMTDGGENSSEEYAQFGQTHGAPIDANGRERLLALLKHHEEAGNWTTIWLGAGLAAAQAAAGLGIAKGATASFTTDDASIHNTYSSLGAVTNSRRSSGMMASATPFADAGVGQNYDSTPGNETVGPDVQATSLKVPEVGDVYEATAGATASEDAKKARGV